MKKNRIKYIGIASYPADYLRLLVLYAVLSSKGEAIPLQAWTGPKGCRRLRLPDFKTIDT